MIVSCSAYGCTDRNNKESRVNFHFLGVSVAGVEITIKPKQLFIYKIFFVENGNCSSFEVPGVDILYFRSEKKEYYNFN